MSETAQGMGNTGASAPIDAICDFVRKTLETVADCVIPPEEARKHFRESRIEFLRGVRTIIDHRIDHLSDKNRGGAKVNVE
jgi:hypothetical protein